MFNPVYLIWRPDRNYLEVFISLRVKKKSACFWTFAITRVITLCNYMRKNAAYFAPFHDIYNDFIGGGYSVLNINCKSLVLKRWFRFGTLYHKLLVYLSLHFILMYISWTEHNVFKDFFSWLWINYFFFIFQELANSAFHSSELLLY